MCEPFGLSAIFASVGSALKVAEVAVRIAEVGSENDVFVRMIRNVRDSLAEVERLLSHDQVQTRLVETPGKIPWIQRTINSSKSALDDIGRWVERARAEQESTGSIHFTTRVRWILNSHEKLVNRTAELGTCHQQLSIVLNYLTPLESVSLGGLKPIPHLEANLDEIFSKHRRRTIVNMPIKGSMTPAPTDSYVPFKCNPLGHNPRSERLPTIISHMSQDDSKTLVLDPVDESSYPPWSSFKEHPTSPPPSYAAVVHSVVPKRQAHMDQKTRVGDTQLEKADPFRANNWGNVNTKFPDAWEYRSAHIDQPVSELAGDAVDISGTNPLGPVDPYEYNTVTRSVAPMGAAACPDVGHLAELLGELAFAAELPSNDQGPPPGYPSRSSRNALFHSASHASSSRAPMERQTVPVYELSAAPKRRPLPSHTTSEPVPSSHQFSPAVSSAELDGRPVGREPVLNQNYYTMAGHESYTRPSGLFAASLSRSPRTPFMSPDAASLPSTTATKMDRTLAPTEPQRSLQHTPSASSARMQRQKQMMDFFGNIGPSS
ncbi:hypothetical protein J1614_009813 [Plenodomus biglobosus]|nr:hypothetical protein J1614_009813 [Plenodomus biglobosus]